MSRYELSVDYVPGTGYNFVFNEGTDDYLSFKIDEDDDLELFFGNETSLDYEENKKRKLTFIYNEFFKDLLPDVSKEDLSREFLHVEGLFSMIEKYIIDHDMYVEKENVNIPIEKDSYRVFYENDTGNISYYIKDYRIKDETGIIISPDGTFFPCLSTRFTDLEEGQKNLRKQIIKEFIYDKLRVNITFDRNADGKLLSIKTLYERAYSDLPKNKEEIPYGDSEMKTKVPRQ